MYTRVPPYPLNVNFETKTDPLGGYAGVQRSSLSASRFAAGQTLYGLMNNRLVSAVVINPSSEGLTDHSTGGLMLQDMHKS